MSYRIEYGPDLPTRYRNIRRNTRLKVMTALWLLVFSLLVRSFFPAGTEELRRVLLADADSVVQNAYSLFLGEVRSGQSVGDAFTVFCRYVIDHEEALPR